MDNNPVRKELPGDIEKEANSKDTEQENRNTQISYKGRHTQGKSTVLQQYQTNMLYFFMILSVLKNL
eukprot:1973469-Ditylum_brightwellii.AAC.1